MRERERLNHERAASLRLLTSAAHALRSYADGYGAPDLARVTAAEIDLLLAKASQSDATEAALTPEPPAGALVREPFTIPAVLTPELRDALGVMCFQTGPIAMLLRHHGGVPIERRAEDEQAVVLHWFLSLVAQHGADWRERVAEHLRFTGSKPHATAADVVETS